MLFFFSQAEDGIRDHCVTGVQTCALPISVATSASPPTSLDTLDFPIGKSRVSRLAGGDADVATALRAIRGTSAAFRSEERRVGNECRSLCAHDGKVKTNTN